MKIFHVLLFVILSQLPKKAVYSQSQDESSPEPYQGYWTLVLITHFMF